MHRFAYLVDRRVGFPPCALAARREDLVDDRRLRRDFLTALADRREERLESGYQPALHLNVADLSFPIAPLEVLDLGLVGIECVVVDEDGISFDPPSIGRADPIRVRIHAHHLPLDGLGVV